MIPIAQRLRGFAIYVCLLGCIAVLGASSPPQEPRALLEAARASGEKDPAGAAKTLERGLDQAQSLTPWYLAELTRLNGLAGDWLAAKRWGERSLTAGVPAELADTASWWYGLALENTGDSSGASRVYRKRIDSGSCSEPLLWLAFFRTGDSGAESGSASLDAAFPLLKLTAPDTYVLSRYLAGICAVRSGEWSFAAVSFSRFESVRAGKYPELAPWAAFYAAWSLNRSGRGAEALSAFKKYLNQWPTHERAWQAATAAALAASQNPSAGSDPVALADIAITRAPTRSDRADSMLLRSTLLIDRGDFAAAARDLPGIADGSLTSGLTPSASRAQFLLAEIAFRGNDFGLATRRWQRLVEVFPADPLAEEALYRIGDARYIEGDWKAAGDSLSRYRLSWPNGRFLASALREGGEAWFRAGSVDLAILWWEDLLKKFPDGSAVPGTMRDLSAAYRARKDWAAALRVAKTYRERFPKEAALDGMDAEIDELTSLNSGNAGDTAAKIAAYAKASKAGTAAGRAIGLSLAKDYLTDWNRRENARTLLAELTEKAPKSPDGQGAADRRVRAEAMSLLANILKEDGSYGGAASLFLSAGAWYAAVDPEKAAEALYGAVDSFLLKGARSDARTTLETMQKTWPDSVWTRRALVAAARD